MVACPSGTPMYLQIRSAKSRLAEPEKTFNSRISPDEDRRDPNRTPEYQLTALCTHALGRRPDRGGSFSSRIFHRPLLPLPTCAAVGDAYSRLYLCADGQRKHQRGGAQFHS